jgi:transposase-like protein
MGSTLVCPFCHHTLRILYYAYNNVHYVCDQCDKEWDADDAQEVDVASYKKKMESNPR